MIVVVGGAGYVGGTVVEYMLEAGEQVCVIDDFSTGHQETLQRLPESVPLYEGDMADKELITRVANEQDVEAVMHFAALALVGESVQRPARYWEHNFTGTKKMIDTWMARGVNKFIFSSTAATYGEPQEIPIPEDHPTQPINPYGRSKRAVEWYLEDLHYSHDLKSICLRYFNAAGAGNRVGEDHDPETHLIPLILQVAGGQRENVDIYGTDYDTRDGTCLRDFVHVKDLAAGHLLAKEKLDEIGCERINLGTKTGHTVKEVIEAARQVTGEKIPATPCKRRAGDPARLVADNKKAKKTLEWEPKHNLKETISDAWRWKQANPEGYT